MKNFEFRPITKGSFWKKQQNFKQKIYFGKIIAMTYIKLSKYNRLNNMRKWSNALHKNKQCGIEKIKLQNVVLCDSNIRENLIVDTACNDRCS